MIGVAPSPHENALRLPLASLLRFSPELLRLELEFERFEVRLWVRVAIYSSLPGNFDFNGQGRSAVPPAEALREPFGALARRRSRVPAVVRAAGSLRGYWVPAPARARSAARRLPEEALPRHSRPAARAWPFHIPRRAVAAVPGRLAAAPCSLAGSRRDRRRHRGRPL